MIELGLVVGIARPLVASASGPASNLLLWTEAMDNAVWTHTLVTITPDAAANPSPPGDGSSTADLCVFGSNRNINQVSVTPAGSGSTSSSLSPTGTWTRFSTTGTFDTGIFTVSVYLQDVAHTSALTLLLDVSGGFIRAQIKCIGGTASINIWGWQLETGGAVTTYVPRTI